MTTQRLLSPVKILDFDLSQPIETIRGLERYVAVEALIRLHGVPLEWIRVPIVNGVCSAYDITNTAVTLHHQAILKHLISDALALRPLPNEFRIADLLDIPHAQPDVAPEIFVTVAVCSRDRPNDLKICLGALTQLDYGALELLVVDNAPSTDETARVVAEFPGVRYIVEPRPGLDWARNRAILEARGEIIAYTDDDAVVDRNWIRAIVQTFKREPSAMAVTGLVLPYELETEAQVMFESYGGFGRGFARRVCRVDIEAGERAAAFSGTGSFGTGANMAYRKRIFEEIGFFDPSLDVGTVTNGGGDIEMFFRVLKHGHTLVYDPEAMVSHRHRRTYAQLRSQIANNGVASYSKLVSNFVTFREERAGLVKFGLWWLQKWTGRRLLSSFIRPLRLPRDLIWGELRGSFTGLDRYRRARRIQEKIVEQFGLPTYDLGPQRSTLYAQRKDSLVKTLDLSQPLTVLEEAGEYRHLGVQATWHKTPLGNVEMPTYGKPVEAWRLVQAISEDLSLKLLEPSSLRPEHLKESEAQLAIANRLRVGGPDTEPGLPDTYKVTIIIPTLGGSIHLENCLRSIEGQSTGRQPGIILLNLKPSLNSGLEALALDHSNVRVVNDPLGRLDRVIAGTTSDIFVTVADDSTMTPTWLEQLIAPLARPDVMVVTGATSAKEFDPDAQELPQSDSLERPGPSQHNEKNVFDAAWFDSFKFKPVPAWSLGDGRNLAFRAEALEYVGADNARVEAGIGLASAPYWFYKVLKAGYAVYHEPSALAWTNLRVEVDDVQRLAYTRSKQSVRYLLMTLFKDGDLRSLRALVLDLPKDHLHNLLEAGRARKRILLTMTLKEIAGNFAGALSLLKRPGRRQHT